MLSISSISKGRGAESAEAQDDAYYTAGQFALIRARFMKKTAGLVAGSILLVMLLMGLFAPFFSPVDPGINGADQDYRRGAPQALYFWDQNGFSWRPFTYTYEKETPKLDLSALMQEGGGLDALDKLTSSGALNASSQNKYIVHEDQRRYLQFFVRGWEYSILSIDALGIDLRWDLHLFGVEQGMIHIMGTDEDGKDVFSRTLHAIWVTISIALVALVVKLFSSLLVGGVSGYFGGKVDAVLMSITEAVRVIPPIPIYLACAVALAQVDLTPTQRYFAIAVVIGALDFATLGRRLRTHILVERTQDYVLAAQLSGASHMRVIWRHLVPSFGSYIIVDTLINFPYVILAETSLSFLGLGLTEPVNSLGVLLQKAQDPDIQQNMVWQFFPVAVFVALVMAFVFVGDALRDAADPYSERNK